MKDAFYVVLIIHLKILCKSFYSYTMTETQTELGLTVPWPHQTTNALFELAEELPCSMFLLYEYRKTPLFLPYEYRKTPFP